MTIDTASPSRFDGVLPADQAAVFADTLRRARDTLGGRTLWHVNSAGQGGGVAEMLQSLLGYLVGGRIQTRWLVIDGNERFFDLTRRVHCLLHGRPLEGELDEVNDREVYESALASDVKTIADMVRPGDPVVLHDPQTLGLAPDLRKAGARLIWSCHIGTDNPNARTQTAQRFLFPYVERTEARGFSRTQHVWSGLDPSTVAIIPPCLDAFSPKNRDLDPDTVDAILSASGIIPADHDGHLAHVKDATAAVSTPVTMIEVDHLSPDSPIVTQVSRWDPLKDHAGVMNGFVRHVSPNTRADLVLAGPAPDAVADDPGSRDTLAALRSEWEALPMVDRRRVHLACLPMNDVDENALIVNALQRRSDVIVQKSLAEGFGLTVAEAMWKARPTIGSRVGGIQDQIEHDRSGLLLDDPDDLPAFGRAITRLLEDRESASTLGSEGRQRVRQKFLAPCYLTGYLQLIDRVLTGSSGESCTEP